VPEFIVASFWHGFWPSKKATARFLEGSGGIKGGVKKITPSEATNKDGVSDGEQILQ